MEKDKFDIRMIEIESKSFEIAMLMSGFVLDILENFDGMKTDVQAELPYFDPHTGYRSLTLKSVFFNPVSNLINIETEELQTSVIWDDLNVAAKEIIINELHHKYKSVIIYQSFSGQKETH